jgi:hypothetical protein
VLEGRRIAAFYANITALTGIPAAKIRLGSCVTSIAGPNGDAQLYER